MFDVVVKRKVNTVRTSKLRRTSMTPESKYAAKARLAWRATSLNWNSKPAHGAKFEFL
jgi:hypothetical protein